MDSLNIINKIINEECKKNDFSGIVLISNTKEENYCSYIYGYENMGCKIKNTIDTRFDTASITKVFTAVSILQLLDKELISLDDKVLDIIDIGEVAFSKDVTLYQLLTHTSGIADDADEEAGEDYEAIWIDKPNYSVRELKDLLPQFIYKEPNFVPGEGCRYNNCGYVLLGLVIEKITGENYRDYITNNIFKAADMNNSGFLAMDDINNNVAEGYKKEFDNEGNLLRYKKNIYSYPSIGTTDGGAFVTAEDMVKFLKALINNKLLSKENSKEMLTPKVLYKKYDTFDKYVGFAFEFACDKNKNEICMMKDGCNAGVACMFKYYKDKDIVVTILSNTDFNVWDLSYKIEKELTK